MNNLTWNVTNGFLAGAIGAMFDTIQSKLANGSRDEKVKFYWGNVCYDALMLSIPVANKIKVSVAEADFMSDHLVWYDTTALISLSSDKNLILTRVTCRDYSRKELVSNGDLNFSISGHITSGIPDIYPSAEVQKFRQVMQYKGIIEVNNEFLDQWGILIDPRQPQKNGYYSVESVNITFCANGYRKELKIPYKVANFKDYPTYI